MFRSNPDVGSLRKNELLFGLLYLPFFLFGVEYLGRLAVRLMGMDPGDPNALVLINLACAVLNTAVLGAVFLRFLAEQLRRVMDRGWALFADLFLGYMLNYGLSHVAAFFAGFLLTVFGLEYFNLNQEAVNAVVSQLPWAAILIMCVLAPLTEELLFRGVLFCGFHRRSRVGAYALSMLAFALAHVLNALLYQPFALSLINLILYLPAGFALAWVYERSGSIWGAIFLHAAINVISLLLGQ